MANGADGSIVIDTELDNTGFQRGSQQMQRAVNSLNGSVNQAGRNMQSAVQSMNSALQVVGRTAQSTGSKFTQYLGAGQFDRAMTIAQKSAQSLVGQLSKIGSAEAAGVKPGSQFERLQMNIQRAEQELAVLKGQMDQLGGQTVETQQFKQITADIAKAEKALFNLYSRRDMAQELGVDESTQGWQRLQIQIRNAEEELTRLEQARDAMQANGTASVQGSSTAEYQQLAATYAQMLQALEVYKQAAAGFNVIEQPANASTAALENVDKELQQKGPDAQQAKGFLADFGGVLKSIAGLGLRAAGGLAKLSFKGIMAGAKGAANGIKGFVNGLKNLRSHSKQSALTSNGLVKALFSVKRMLLSRIKRTFISSLFNSLKAGMSSFARYSSSFNAAMSSMKNSMTGLSGNLAVTAGNLVSAIAPAISTIIDWISKAITYLNAFFALLAGKSTYSVAKKGTDDYAKSLKGAGGAAKDLKNQVYGFDELNRADDNSGGGGGGGGSGGSVDFTEEDINSLPSSLANFMQSIKDAFAAEQFEEVGAILGRGLNGIVTTIDDWINNKMRPFAVLWSANLARILNGLVDAFDWTNFGKLFADGFNAVTDTLNTFLTTFDFDALAQSLGDGINGLFDNVDWALLGQTVGNGLQSIFNLFWGTLASVNWTSLGSNLATGVNTLFASIDWAKAGTNLSNSLKGIINGIKTFLLETDWQAIGNDAAEFLAAIDWNGISDAIFEGIGVALASLAELIWGLIKPAWDSVVGWWDEAMEANGGDVIATLLQGITTALANIGTWCNEHIIKPLLSGIETALGLEEGTIANVATQLWTDFKNDIVTAWNTISSSVGEFFTGVWDAIVGFFGTLGDTATNIWSDFTTGISNGWNSVKTAVTSTVSGAWESIKGVFTGIGDVAADIWNGLKNGLSTGWTSLKESILKPFKDMWQAVKDFFGIASPSTEAASVGDFILQGLVNGFKSAVDGVISTVTAIFGRIWNAIKSIFGFGGESDESKEAKQAGKDIMTGMKDGIKGDEESVKTEIKNAAKNALQALRTELGIPDGGGSSTKAKTYGEGIMSGLSDGIVSKGVVATFTAAATAAWSAVQSALNTAFGTKEGGSASKSKYVGETTVSGINDGINNKAKNSTFTTAATAALTAVKAALNTAFGMSSDSSNASKTKYAGEGIVGGIVDGINGKAVSTTFSGVASSVQSAIASAFNTALGISGGWGSASSSSKFKDVGKAICQGVADGISANTSTIKTAATQAAQAALTAAKNKLGINSPSKAFAEIGNFMMAGMSNGLKTGQSTVTKTMAGIAGSLMDSMADTSLDVNGDAMVRGLDHVADKLDSISRIFAGIAGAIGDLGGTLPMPSVATGEFAPYRVRQEGDGAGMDTIAQMLNRLASDRDEDESSLRDLIRELIEVVRGKNLNVDGPSLERTLNALQRDRVRAYGGA